jgi:hypothetical protein
MFGAVVTPPSTKDYSDISYVAQLRTFGKGPEGSASGVGFKQGHPHLAVMEQGQLRDDIAQMLAVGQLPGTRESNDKEPPSRLRGFFLARLPFRVLSTTKNKTPSHGGGKAAKAWVTSHCTTCSHGQREQATSRRKCH